MHNIITSEDIYDGVVKYASGYDKKNIVNLNQSKSKIVTDTVFLNNVSEHSLIPWMSLIQCPLCLKKL